MFENESQGGAPGINQPGAGGGGVGGAPGGAGSGSSSGSKPAGELGTIKFHLACSYHADLAEQPTMEAAQAAAADHLRTQHAPDAKNAEVVIHQVTHFTFDDAAKLKAAAKP
jgi:hypothetical protein